MHISECSGGVWLFYRRTFYEAFFYPSQERPDAKIRGRCSSSSSQPASSGTMRDSRAGEWYGAGFKKVSMRSPGLRARARYGLIGLSLFERAPDGPGFFSMLIFNIVVGVCGFFRRGCARVCEFLLLLRIEVSENSLGDVNGLLGNTLTKLTQPLGATKAKYCF